MGRRSKSTWAKDDMVLCLKDIAKRAADSSSQPMRSKGGELQLDGEGRVIMSYDPSIAAVALKAIKQASELLGYESERAAEPSLRIDFGGLDIGKWAN